MIFGLRCSQPACRPHPASLPVRLSAVEGLLRASFSFTSRLRLAFRYGYRHRFRLAPFIQRDSAHAGHTGASFQLAAGFSPLPTTEESPQSPALKVKRARVPCPLRPHFSRERFPKPPSTPLAYRAET